MQFKEVGKRIQVLAYRGYDKEKKRAIIKLMGSMCQYELCPSVELMNSLTDEEKKELQTYINDKSQSYKKGVLQSLPKSICSQIEHLSNSLNSKETDISAEQANLLFERIDLLSKALKKSGHKKPAKATQKPTDAAQGDLLG